MRGCTGTGAGITLRLWIRRTRPRRRGASRGAEGLARAGLGPVDAERVAEHVADVGRAVAVAVRAGALADLEAVGGGGASGRGRRNSPRGTAGRRGSPATGRPGAGGGELRHDAARHGGSRFEILPGLAVLVFGEEVPVPGPQRAGARLAGGREPPRGAVALPAERLDGGGPAAVGPSDQPAVAAPGDGWGGRARLPARRGGPGSVR